MTVKELDVVRIKCAICGTVSGEGAIRVGLFAGRETSSRNDFGLM